MCIRPTQIQTRPKKISASNGKLDAKSHLNQKEICNGCLLGKGNQFVSNGVSSILQDRVHTQQQLANTKWTPSMFRFVHILFCFEGFLLLGSVVYFDFCFLFLVGFLVSFKIEKIKLDR